MTSSAPESPSDAPLPSPADVGADAAAQDAGAHDTVERARPLWLTRWPVVFVLFFIPTAVWSLASPLFSVPDEPVHAAKAVALWTSQPGVDRTRPDGLIYTSYDLPMEWTQALDVTDCFRLKEDVTADCAPAFGDPSTEHQPVLTYVGHYPPLFYALVGWGGRFFGGAKGMYLMRLTSAALMALFLALAVRQLALVIRPRWALIGALAAATPMTYFFGGSVNPNGLEVAAAAATWAGALAVFRWPEHHAGPFPRRAAVWLLVAGFALTFTRSLSPEFLGAALVLSMLSARVTSVRALLKDRFIVLIGAGLVVAAAASQLFIITGKALATFPGAPIDPNLGPLRTIVGELPNYAQQQIGIFGWLETGVPQLSFYLWMLVIFGLLAVSLSLAPMRRNLALIVTFGASIVLPIAAELPGAAQNGIAWQGRYSLPLLVGVPLVAVATIDPVSGLIPGLSRRFTIACAAALGTANLYAAYFALHRYAVGKDGPIGIFSAAWQPHLGSAALLALMLAFAVATVVFVALPRSGTPDAPDPDPDVDPVPRAAAGAPSIAVPDLV